MLGLLAFALPRAAQACSFSANPHQLDAAETAIDTTPPSTPVVGPITISRGHGPSRSGCGSMASSCDDLGAVTFSLSATDDRTSAAMMGFRITASRPESVEGLFPLDMDVRPYDGKMTVRWVDGATDDQESLDFDLEVRAIDLAGNVSAEGAIVRVRQDPGGCRIGRGATAGDDSVGVVVFAFAALTTAVRRRRPALPRPMGG